MATTANHFIKFAMILFALLIINSLHFTAGQVGVCFGRVANNIPGAAQTVALYQKTNIRRMRLYEPHPPTLRALANTGIRLMLGVPPQDLPDLANCPDAATAWLRRNVLRFPNVTLRYISVGNEIEPASPSGPYVLPAMQNMYRAVRAAGRAAQIKISTSIKTDLLNTSYPPQAGEFKCSVNWYIRPILEFLSDTNSPILVNIYPYFAYINDMKNINLSFALLQPNSGVVAGGVYYDNLFYAMLDAVDVAIERILAASSPLLSLTESGGGGGTKPPPKTTVSETGHPSKGGGSVPPPPPKTKVSETGHPSKGGGSVPHGLNDGPVNTVENARIYNNNLMRIVRTGTPRNPGQPIETYIFAMYDENLKPGPAYERHFGIFTPNGQPKYPLRFR